MCVHIFSDSGNNSNIFLLSLRVWSGEILVCYQLVNKPHDCVNVLQDIWEDNVTIINFFTTLSHEKCSCRTLYVLVYIIINLQCAFCAQIYFSHSTKHLLFFMFLLFCCIHKVIDFTTANFFFFGFWFLLCRYVLCIWKEAC